ncbi:transporter [Massilia sp. IC2-476]|uniref:transporter n=1 Tax=Massilia sp. IC2-476 TaxID=2887199 RepID=UPI001D12BDD8|nr:transporter [Massilia sp. IC2-476]MCC2972295.1 transporter [Massilia sp. IC2-476]
MKHTLTLAAITLACCAAGAHAQERDDIEADRPDFVESTRMVGKGRVQLETSLLFEREREREGEGRKRTLSTPTLLRIGLAEALELRVETEGRMIRHSREEGRRVTETGYGDTALGLSWHALDPAGPLPSVGVHLAAELDSGSRAFRGEGVRPSLRMAAEWELPNEVKLGVMPGIGVEREEGGRYRYGIFGIVAEKEFGERLRGLVELALPRIARAKHGGTEASFDVGAAYLLSKDVQLDAMLSRGLNSRSPDIAFTIGLSIRR